MKSQHFWLFEPKLLAPDGDFLGDFAYNILEDVMGLGVVVGMGVKVIDIKVGLELFVDPGQAV